LTSAFDTVLHIQNKEGLTSDERYAEILDGAEAAGRGAAARLLETIERMRYLTNLDRAEEQTIDVNELCRETAASLKSDLEGKTNLDFDLGVVPPLRCRPQQLSAVLSNLFRNAADAIETRGRITVSTRKRDGNVVLEVRDTGRGIPRPQLQTLFEPSFQVDGGRVTTTNWGLFVCRAIVAEHGGQLEIDSEVGKGTTARIVLPWALRAEQSTELPQ
jgi:two-component system NtrC family sensor kinase